MRHRGLRGDGAARFGSAEIPPADPRQVDAGRCGCPAFWCHSNTPRRTVLGSKLKKSGSFSGNATAAQQTVQVISETLRLIEAKKHLRRFIVFPPEFDFKCDLRICTLWVADTLYVG
jgi:hypothetical protein